MKAYKAFNGNLTCTKGDGTYQYASGGTYLTDASQTARRGFHCCENPVDCLTWYGLPLADKNQSGSRIFMVEAAGDIDEIDDKIACTQLTLVKELDLKALVLEIVRYIILYPNRPWPRLGKLFEIAEDSAEAPPHGFAISRGQNPVVRGGEGAVIAVLVEDAGSKGAFTEAKLGRVNGIELQPDVWYTVQNGEWRMMA